MGGRSGPAGRLRRDRGRGPGARQFLVETVACVEADAIVVDGHGRTGAWAGDSGGPLLARDLTGAPTVLGVLARGASSCVGEDVYVRADRAGALIPRGADPPRSRDCGDLPEDGACHQGVAVWCAGGLLAAEACGERHCRWTDAGAYACSNAATTPCGDVDQLGACAGDSARRCEAGTLVEEECAAAELRCVRAADTGIAHCA
jgi:hypothetical protein